MKPLITILAAYIIALVSTILLPHNNITMIGEILFIVASWLAIDKFVIER